MCRGLSRDVQCVEACPGMFNVLRPVLGCSICRGLSRGCSVYRGMSKAV